MSGLEGGGLTGGGVGGSYQPGVYVPLKALFLVDSAVGRASDHLVQSWSKLYQRCERGNLIGVGT